jgi:hypothetical protein
MGIAGGDAGLATSRSESMSQIHPLTFYQRLVWVDGYTPLIDTIEPYRQDIFTNALYTFRPDGIILYKRVLTGRTKKTFKTSDAMLSGIYKLFVWKAAGSKGNQIYIVASDLAQANDDLDLTKKFIRCNPLLNELVIVKTNVIELKDGTGFMPNPSMARRIFS